MVDFFVVEEQCGTTHVFFDVFLLFYCIVWLRGEFVGRDLVA